MQVYPDGMRKVAGLVLACSLLSPAAAADAQGSGSVACNQFRIAVVPIVVETAVVIAQATRLTPAQVFAANYALAVRYVAIELTYDFQPGASVLLADLGRAWLAAHALSVDVQSMDRTRETRDLGLAWSAEGKAWIDLGLLCASST